MNPGITVRKSAVTSVRPPMEGDVLLLGRTLSSPLPYLVFEHPMWVHYEDQSFWYANGYFSQEMLDTWRAVDQANKEAGINTDF